jgi:single-stranded DNA-binding protein
VVGNNFQMIGKAEGTGGANFPSPSDEPAFTTNQSTAPANPASSPAPSNTPEVTDAVEDDLPF